MPSDIGLARVFGRFTLPTGKIGVRAPANFASSIAMVNASTAWCSHYVVDASAFTGDGALMCSRTIRSAQACTVG